MAVAFVAFVFSLIIYLALTAGSGGFLLWSSEEIFFGIVTSLLTAVLVKILFSSFRLRLSFQVLSPVRWLTLIVFAVGPFFYHMLKANLDVAYRVITGKIKPGIVKIHPGLKTNFGLTMLANSITLTPGTLTVDTDKEKNLYVHWIYVLDKEPTAEEVCSSFPKWVRRIAE